VPPVAAPYVVQGIQAASSGPEDDFIKPILHRRVDRPDPLTSVPIDLSDGVPSVDHANATVLAPAMTSSTTLAAPTMTDPLRSCSSPMPRGFAQAPQSQTVPPLSMNS
jgi:hypothetical protein